MNTKFLKRHCQICNCITAQILTSIDYLCFEKFELPSRYDIVSCNSCGFVFNDSTACQIDYDDYYKSSAKYDTKGISGGGGVSAMDQDRFQQLIDFISPHIKTSDTILDMGCAKGGLLQLLKRQGFDNLIGIDPSPYCINLLKATKIDGSVGNIFNIGTPINNSIDIFLLTAVLEHIYDLKRAIQSTTNSLRNNGLLLIEVPDASRYKEFIDTPYYRFDLEHINHFSLPHLQNLLCQSGYELLSYKSINVPVSQSKKAPSLMTLFRKEQKATLNINPDFFLRSYIEEYIQISEKNDKYPDIDTLFKNQNPIYIWGLGAHTSRLLKKTKLSGCNIIAFIDNDPNKKGKEILGKPILSSDYLVSGTETVVICSVLYKDEMIGSLKNIEYKGSIVALV